MLAVRERERERERERDWLITHCQATLTDCPHHNSNIIAALGLEILCVFLIFPLGGLACYTWNMAFTDTTTNEEVRRTRLDRWCLLAHLTRCTTAAQVATRFAVA